MALTSRAYWSGLAAGSPHLLIYSDQRLETWSCQNTTESAHVQSGTKSRSNGSTGMLRSWDVEGAGSYWADAVTNHNPKALPQP